jgi:hypothetical protein
VRRKNGSGRRAEGIACWQDWGRRVEALLTARARWRDFLLRDIRL